MTKNFYAATHDEWAFVDSHTVPPKKIEDGDSSHLEFHRMLISL